MTLTAYQARTCPQPVPIFAPIPLIGVANWSPAGFVGSGFIGAGGATTFSIGATGFYINPGDYIVLSVYAPAAPSSIAIANGAGIAFVLQKSLTDLFIYTAQYTGSTPIYAAGPISVTFGSSQAWALGGATIIRGASSMIVGAGQGPSVKAASSTALFNTGAFAGGAGVVQNSLALTIAAWRNSATGAAIPTGAGSFASAPVSTMATFAPAMEFFTTGSSSQAQFLKMAMGQVEQGLGTYQAQFTVATNVSITTNGILIVFTGEEVSVDDLTMMVTEDGPLLNSPINTLPLYDISQMQGLSGLFISSETDQIDGADGSYVAAKFASGKTVIIDGTLYANPPIDEGLFDALKIACSPVGDDIPFIYKPNNNPPRVLMCKPIAFTADWDRGRAIGSCDFEIQLQSEDAFSSDLALLTARTVVPTTGQTYQEQLVVTGNTESFPDIYFNVYSAEIGLGTGTYFQFLLPQWIQNNYATAADVANYSGICIISDQLAHGLYWLDCKNRMLKRAHGDGTWDDYSSCIGIPSTGGNPLINGSGRQWPALQPQQTNTLIMLRPAAGGITTDGFTVVYANAWR
jgi:hypothetical protein